VAKTHVWRIPPGNWSYLLGPPAHFARRNTHFGHSCNRIQWAKLSCNHFLVRTRSESPIPMSAAHCRHTMRRGNTQARFPSIEQMQTCNQSRERYWHQHHSAPTILHSDQLGLCLSRGLARMHPPNNPGFR